MNTELADVNLVPNGNFGNDPAIRPKNPHYIEIKHVARFQEGCFDSCNGSLGRKYFQVYEYGYEWNEPIACGLLCFSCPPNFCCPGFDWIYKTYFDRGIYDQQDCAHKIGCISGDPVIFPGEIEYLCCCIPCCDPCACQCCSPGERVRVIPCETYYCCCSNRATCFTNCCGLCGPKTGQPLILWSLVGKLQTGEAAKLANALNTSRAEWKSRVGK